MCSGLTNPVVDFSVSMILNRPPGVPLRGGVLVILPFSARQEWAEGRGGGAFRHEDVWGLYLLDGPTDAEGERGPGRPRVVGGTFPSTLSTRVWELKSVKDVDGPTCQGVF